MFSDLPRIDLCGLEQQPQQQQLRAFEDDSEDSCWPFLYFTSMAENEYYVKSTMSPFPGYPQMSSMQRFLQHEERPLFNAVLPQSNPDFCQLTDKNYPPPGLGVLGESNPLPQNVKMPHDSYPKETLSSDWTTPEESISGATNSGWSPRTSESYPDCSSWTDPHGFDTRYSYGGFAPGLPQPHSMPSPQSSTGIALSEIQQLPDTEPEDALVEQGQQDASKPYTSYFETSEGRHQPIQVHQSRLEDEGIGSSIHESAIDSPVSPDDDSTMDVDNIKDDGSEYSPLSRLKNVSTRRTSRSSLSTKSPVSPNRKRNKIPKSITSPVTTHAKISKRSSTSTSTSSKSAPAANTSYDSPITPSQSRSDGKSMCPHCSSSHSSQSALNKHILASHTRPFVCTFRRYGCTSTFASKNEWKRHVSSQHLRLGIYRCDIGACVPHARPSNPQHHHHHRRTSSSSSAVEAPLYSHNDFNRKDLFTQHLRRMHGPGSSASKTEQERFGRELEDIKRRCWKPLRETPRKTVCGFCASASASSASASASASSSSSGGLKKKEYVFEGSGSWDDRMEHVGRHLEKGDDDEVEDVGLREWMVAEGLLEHVVGGGWRVYGSGAGRRRGRGCGSGSISGKQEEEDIGEEDAMGDDE
ncbi:MAG: hypothetical protein Q9190_002408 [Brigantiaea leucoxantha]